MVFSTTVIEFEQQWHMKIKGRPYLVLSYNKCMLSEKTVNMLAVTPHEVMGRYDADDAKRFP
jgi:hypothetical protein